MEITLRSARINNGYTQEQAAKLIGISKDTLRNYENGKSFPDVPVIKRIEDIYGIPYQNLKFCPEITE